MTLSLNDDGVSSCQSIIDNRRVNFTTTNYEDYVTDGPKTSLGQSDDEYDAAVAGYVGEDEQPTLFRHALQDVADEYSGDIAEHAQDLLDTIEQKRPDIKQREDKSGPPLPTLLKESTNAPNMFAQDGQLLRPRDWDTDVAYPYSSPPPIDEYQDAGLPSPINACEHAPECPVLGHEFSSTDDVIDFAKDCEIAYQKGCPILELEFADGEETIDFQNTTSLNGVEIFKTGTHRGERWTADDLHDLADNFQSLRDEIKPPAKIGHSNQLAIQDGLPAVGWATDVYVDGDTLKADFDRVPQKVAELIQSGAFVRTSAEILRNFQSADGHEFEKVLAGVALLGADLPEITTLEDVDDVFSQFTDQTSETDIYTFENDTQEFNFVPDNPSGMEPVDGDSWDAIDYSEFVPRLHDEFDYESEEGVPSFADLPVEQKRWVASRFGYVKGGDIDEDTTYGDLSLEHHRPNGDVDREGVIAARQRLETTDISEDAMEGVDQHLIDHLENDFSEENVSSVLADESTMERSALELKRDLESSGLSHDQVQDTVAQLRSHVSALAMDRVDEMVSNEWTLNDAIDSIMAEYDGKREDIKSVFEGKQGPDRELLEAMSSVLQIDEYRMIETANADGLDYDLPDTNENSRHGGEIRMNPEEFRSMLEEDTDLSDEEIDEKVEQFSRQSENDEDESESDPDESVSEHSNRNIESLEAEVKQLREESRHDRIQEMASRFKRQGKILPKQEDEFRQLLKGPDNQEFSREQEKDWFETVENFMESMEPQVDESEYTNRPSSDSDSESAGSEQFTREDASELAEDLIGDYASGQDE